MAERFDLATQDAFPAEAQWVGDGIAINPLGAMARWSLRLPSTRAERMSEVAGLRIDMAINRCAGADDRIVARLGPDEWLLCAPIQGAEECQRLLSVVLGAGPHALVDVSHRYAALAVEGRQASIALAAGCPLDLDLRAFGPGTATRTLLGKAEIILWRLGGASSYRVECARSYADYVYAFLREASREFSPLA